MKLPYTVKILGVLLMFFSIAQLIPVIVAFIYSETAHLYNFSITFIITFFSGLALYRFWLQLGGNLGSGSRACKVRMCAQ